MDNSNTKKYNLTNRILFILLIIIIVLGIIIPARFVGMLSKLKYPSVSNYIKIPYVYNQAAEIESNEEIIDDSEYKIRMNELAENIVKFVYDTYHIELKIPKYTLVLTDNEYMSNDGSYDNIAIKISRSKLEREPGNYEALFVHELFHLLSCQDGVRTRMCKESEYSSYFSEGFTDILTDKFIEYMKWDDYIKLRGRTNYYYYSELLECIFAKEGNELKFARYYFFDDFSFIDEFDKKVREATFVSLLYSPYKALEVHSYEMNAKDFKSEEDFLLTFEIVSYYCSTFEKAEKETVKKHYKIIETWSNSHVYDYHEGNYTYFYDILFNRT